MGGLSLLAGDDPKLLEKVNGLIEECRRHPFTGSGEPEPLRFELKGWWLRWITRYYRVAGSGDNKRLEIAQCQLHY